MVGWLVVKFFVPPVQCGKSCMHAPRRLLAGFMYMVYEHADDA